MVQWEQAITDISETRTYRPVIFSLKWIFWRRVFVLGVEPSYEHKDIE